MTSVGAELPRQIERVAAKRQRWRWRTEGLRKEGFRAMAASIEQTIAVMTRDLDAASEAIGSGGRARLPSRV